MAGSGLPGVWLVLPAAGCGACGLGALGMQGPWGAGALGIPGRGIAGFSGLRVAAMPPVGARVGIGARVSQACVWGVSVCGGCGTAGGLPVARAAWDCGLSEVPGPQIWVSAQNPTA